MTPRRLGRVLRTLRPLRRAQLLAQLRHRLRGSVRPRGAPGPPPPLAATRASTHFLGAPAHAFFDGGLRLRLLNREVVFREQVDWDFSGEGPLWAYHLHQFDWARHASLAPAARRRLVLDWIERHPRGVGWQPHPLSLRIASWIRLLLTPSSLALSPEEDARVRASLADQADTLAANLETHLLANHYLSNLLAVVLAGIAFEGPRADAWRSQAGALREALSDQVDADGAHVERSPMYHALLLESVLDLLNVCGALPARTPPALASALREAAARMLGALRTWTLPDGGISLFGDSAHGIAQPLSALERYAMRLGIEPVGPGTPGLLSHAGYVRLERGPFVLLASVAGPQPPYQPGHAHCDALAFELCVGSERVVTDTGVAEYIPGPLRDLSRATRSHATLEVGGRDQAELWAAHRVGGRPIVALRHVEPGRSLEASCASWSTPDSLHVRRVELTEAGVEILDRLEGRPRAVRLVLPLAPGLEPRLGRWNARLRLAAGGSLRIELPAGPSWRVERALCFPEFGRALERAVLVGEADSLPEGRWRFALER